MASQAENPSDRYHALDSLRAAMMLLGIVLHAGVSYMVLPIPGWPYQDPRSSAVFDVGVTYIHIFRMPGSS